MFTHIVSWFQQKGYFQGVAWMIAACAVSNLNDILVKHMGSHLPGMEVAFFRFLFSALVLLPFMITRGRQAFSTQHLSVHFIRALLLVLAVAPWCYGVASLPLTLATTLSFTTPFFVLPLAKIFLGEKVGIHRCLATAMGFTGILISLQPTSDGFNPMALALVVSTIMFASLDIINKKMLIKDESMLSMLFYSALGTTLLGAIPTFFVWKTPMLSDFGFLVLLGCGANLILYCLLKGFAATEISSLQPFRYFELILSAIFGLVIFGEFPTASTLIAAAFIIPATLYIVIYETKKQRMLKKTSNIQEAA